MYPVVNARSGVAPIIALLLISGVLAGCGGGTKRVGVIKGQVFWGDQPLAGAVITFRQKEGDSPLSFPGTTKDDGKFEIPIPAKQSYKGGTFQVVVSKQVPKSGKIPKDLDPDQMKFAGEMKELLPSRYSDPTVSELTVDLKEGENDVGKINLKKP